VFGEHFGKKSFAAFGNNWQAGSLLHYLRPMPTWEFGLNSGWTPAHTFEQGIRETVQWYLDNQNWVKLVLKK